MTIQIPDFSNLTPVQFFLILLVVALLDWVTGIIGAVRSKTFDLQLVLDVLQSHGIAKILPIGALFGVGVVAAIPGLCLLADGLLALYFVQTIQSAYGNLGPVPTPPVAQ